MSLSDFQTGIGVAAHATLDTEQLISHTWAALVDTGASLWGSNGGDVTVSEIHKPLTKIHDILDSAVSKWVCNTGNILAFLFGSTCR